MTRYKRIIPLESKGPWDNTVWLVDAEDCLMPKNLIFECLEQAQTYARMLESEEIEWHNIIEVALPDSFSCN
jgi:hypothetical protein